jgi:hypothetical protein
VRAEPLSRALRDQIAVMGLESIIPGDATDTGAHPR